MQPISKARLEQFSDGVFAIAITLLAIELKVPHLTSSDVGSALGELRPLIPNIATFILSFIAIAIYWVNHHQLTRSIETVSRRIIWINMLLLMFITLIPFATAVVGENPAHTLSVLTYSLIMLGSSVSFSLLHYVIHKHQGYESVSFKRSIIGPLFYLGAAVTSLVSVEAAYVFLLIPPLFYFLPRS